MASSSSSSNSAELPPKKRVNGLIQVSVIQMDVVNDIEKAAVSIGLKPQSTNGELLSLITDKLNIKLLSTYRSNKIECGKISDGQVKSVTLLYGDRKLIYQWVSAGDTLYVAINTKDNTPYSHPIGFKHKLHEMATNIVIYHNKINKNMVDNVNNKNIIYDQKMSVNITIKLITLKLQICQTFGIPLNEVIIRKEYHGQALRDNHSTLKSYNIHRNKIIYVERGKLKDNEFIFQIFIQNEIKQRYILCGWIRENVIHFINQIIPDTINDLIFEYYYIQKGDDPLIYVDDITLHKDWSMNKIKDIISKQCKGKVPKIKRMRIREFVNNRLSRLYYDDKTLSENCGSSIKDYKQICIQRKWRKNEPDITKKFILMNCIRWYPKTSALGPMIEFAFLKKTKIRTDLKIELSDIIQIDAVYLEYTLVHGYKLKEYIDVNPSGRWNSHWNAMFSMTNNKNTLVSKPWLCKQGDILLYVDNREF